MLPWKFPVWLYAFRWTASNILLKWILVWANTECRFDWICQIWYVSQFLLFTYMMVEIFPQRINWMVHVIILHFSTCIYARQKEFSIVIFTRWGMIFNFICGWQPKKRSTHNINKMWLRPVTLIKTYFTFCIEYVFFTLVWFILHSAEHYLWYCCSVM